MTRMDLLLGTAPMTPEVMGLYCFTCDTTGVLITRMGMRHQCPHAQEIIDSMERASDGTVVK